MKKQSIVKNIVGLLVLVTGLLLLLNAVKVIDVSSLLSTYWPLAIVLGGVIIIINDIKSWALGVLVMTLGGMFQLNQLKIVDVEPWAVIWPLVVVYIGLSLLFNKSYAGKRVSKNERDDVTAILGGAKALNSSKKFMQSNVTAIMGGAVLDLRKATIEDGAVVEVFSFWGGIEIILPENVIVRNQMNNILAGSEDKTNQSTSKSSPTIVITGTLIMAGASIQNTPSY